MGHQQPGQHGPATASPRPPGGLLDSAAVASHGTNGATSTESAPSSVQNETRPHARRGGLPATSPTPRRAALTPDRHRKRHGARALGSLRPRQRNRRPASRWRVKATRSALSAQTGTRPRRVLAAGDADRQRIERDLYDGVQQRLIGLGIRLALAAESFQERGDTDAGAALNGFREEVQQAIEEVRAFARGVNPLLLASNGLCGTRFREPLRHRAGHGVSVRGTRRRRPKSRTRSTSPASPQSTTQPSTPARRRFPSMPGTPPTPCTSPSATPAVGLTQTGHRPGRE